MTRESIRYAPPEPAAKYSANSNQLETFGATGTEDTHAQISSTASTVRVIVIFASVNDTSWFSE